MLFLGYIFTIFQLREDFYPTLFLPNIRIFEYICITLFGIHCNSRNTYPHNIVYPESSETFGAM